METAWPPRVVVNDDIWTELPLSVSSAPLTVVLPKLSCQPQALLLPDVVDDPVMLPVVVVKVCDIVSTK